MQLQYEFAVERKVLSMARYEEFVMLDVSFGLILFDDTLNPFSNCMLVSHLA